MRILVTSAAIAAVCSLSLVAALAAQPPARAGTKTKTFKCATGPACVTAANSAAGEGANGAAVSGAGVYGATPSRASGVYGENDNSLGGQGIAGLAFGSNTSAAILANAGTHGGLPLLVASFNTGIAYMIVGVSNSHVEFHADTTGDLHVNTMYTGGICKNGCAGTRSGAYATQSSEPGIQDSGEAQLHGGVAFVPLDPAYANAIDARSKYVVLLTPEDSTGGLFVAERGPEGFVVRQSHGGKGSAAFAYRIFAHPYGVRSTRFPRQRDLPIGARR